MPRGYRIPVVLQPQSEGGFTVTSPVIPELFTEGDTLDEALQNVEDAFAAILELYEEAGRALPEDVIQDLGQDPIRTDVLVAAE